MENNKFKFTYSAPSSEERKEIESILYQYKERPITKENKIEELKKLDYKVKNTPLLIGLIVGILGCLIFGVGLTMILEWALTVWGVIVAVIGVPIMVIAYPLYKKMLLTQKEKYKDKIITLSEEILSIEEEK